MIWYLRPVRRFVAFLLLALLVGAIAGAPLRVTAKSPTIARELDAQQEGLNRAGLVIRYEDGDVETACVSFAEPVIYGDDVLQLAGIDSGIATDGRICSIDGVGCGPNDCWCQCTDLNNCTYWAYYHLAGSAWEYSGLGATISEVRNGAVEGWSWGQGNFVSAIEPPLYTFDQICAAASPATATPTLTPTATVEGQPTTTLPPQVSLFQASPATLSVGVCTTLEWSVTNADEVLVDGATVGAQGQKQDCPNTSRNYSLLAVNAAGSTAREVTVLVSGAGAAQPTVIPSPTWTRPVAAPRPSFTSVPTAMIAASPMPGQFAVDATAAGSTQPQIVMHTPTPAATVTPYQLAMAPSATPRPRRVLGADGRPTPTPILLARTVAGAPTPGSERQTARTQTTRTAGSTSGRVTADRSFQSSYLPGYAAFLFMVACLAVMGVWIMRRRVRGAPAYFDSATRGRSQR